MPKALPFRLFYSWQSDSPAKTNLNAIRDGLKLAKKDIESRRTGVKIVLDEATRDKSGAVNIAGTILEKIAIADMVLADVTTIRDLGARLRALRIEAGLSQEDLAYRSGLHRNYIGGIERGERNVGIKAILAICRALNRSPADVFRQ